MFLGTSVVSGTGTAVAIATGAKTMFGDIAARLRTRAPETEFERGLRRFSLLILRTTVVLVLFILLVSIALQARPVRVAAVRRRPGGRPHAGVPADDQLRHARPGGAADGARRR